MSIESVLQRVVALEQALSNPAALIAARTGGTAAAGESPGPLTESPGTAALPPASTAPTSFAAALQSANAGISAPGSPYQPPLGMTGINTLLPASLTTNPSTGIGGRIVALAESQLGQAEQPPGSNESPAIAQYRGATAGAVPGAPWCGYFASWAARQAGAPLGAQGEGLGSVSAIWSWAQSSGRAVPNGPGVTPQPGDLIVFGGEHVGIVRGVLPNGEVQTIEGNYGNRVSLNVRTPGEASGYVRVG
jgi:CHAP domain